MSYIKNVILNHCGYEYQPFIFYYLLASRDTNNIKYNLSYKPILFNFCYKPNFIPIEYKNNYD